MKSGPAMAARGAERALANPGWAFGIPAALVAGRLMSSQLWGVGSYDPWSLAGATSVLALCATADGFIPAHRAASIEPMQALRTE